MLIRALRAQNFMKFASLRLESIPLEGSVGIEGPNESGKSTIGEAILFALFGRSRLAKRCPLESLIRWGSDHLRVELEFVLPGGESSPGSGDGAPGHYLICREIDRSGTNYVKLLSLPEGREIAAGNGEVADFIAREVGFDFFEFHQAFYHDQYAQRTVDAALVDFVERMTGLTHMQLAGDEIRKELEQLEREHGHYQRDIARNGRQIEHYARNVDRRPELESQLESVRREQEETRVRLQAGKSFAESLRQFVQEREACRSRLQDLAAARGEELLGGVGTLAERYGEAALEPPPGDAEVAGEVESFRREIEALREDLRRLGALVTHYRHLHASFRAAREALEAALDAGNEESLVTRYERDEKERALLNDKASRGRWLVWIPALVGLAALAAGAVPLLAPGLLESTVSGPRAVPLALPLAGVAVVSLGLTLWAALRIRGLNSRESLLAQTTAELWSQVESTRAIREQLLSLDTLFAGGDIHEFLAAAEPLSRGVTRAQLEEFRASHRDLLAREGGDGGHTAYRRRLEALAGRERQLQKRAATALGVTEKGLQELQGAARRLRSDRDRLENEVRDCLAQQAKMEALEEKTRELEAAAQRVLSQIEDRRDAIQLLQDTAEAVRSRVGPVLGSFVRQVLPHLTGGRYRDVKVNDRLEIQVYVERKCDFLPPGALSGGTREALMLALRLAFAEGFVLARSRGPQFLFLDEPFKMMDVGRALEALHVLRRLSPNVRQLFVLQPDYTDEQRRRFDCVVTTEVEVDALACDFRPSDRAVR